MVNHETILKRPDGSRVKIVVRFIPEWSSNDCIYKSDVMICRPKKRTFYNPINDLTPAYRCMSREARCEFIENEYLKYVTEAEILEAKRELWKKMEPK